MPKVPFSVQPDFTLRRQGKPAAFSDAEAVGAFEIFARKRTSGQ